MCVSFTWDQALWADENGLSSQRISGLSDDLPSIDQWSLWLAEAEGRIVEAGCRPSRRLELPLLVFLCSSYREKKDPNLSTQPMSKGSRLPRD